MPLLSRFSEFAVFLSEVVNFFKLKTFHSQLLDFETSKIKWNLASFLLFSAFVGSELHRVATCPPQHHREGSPISASATSHSFSATTTSQSITRTSDTCFSQSEWYSSLVELLIDDLIEYAKEFPLQIRWIYSELQVSSHPSPNCWSLSLPFFYLLPFVCLYAEMSRVEVDKCCVVQPPLPSRHLPVHLHQFL